MNRTERITSKDLLNLSAHMDDACDRDDRDEIKALCERLEASFSDDGIEQAQIFYVAGTGHNHLISRKGTPWFDDSTANATLNFRKSLATITKIFREAFMQTNDYSVAQLEQLKDLQSRVTTNYANELDYQGRSLEALQLYDQAIALNDNVHAHLGKGKTLIRLANSLFDDGHRLFHYRQAYQSLSTAYRRIDEFQSPQKEMILNDQWCTGFIDWVENELSQSCDINASLDELPGGTFDTRKERDYFNWCMEKRLFLNDLNDISTSEVVNQDIIGLASFSRSINEALTTSEELVFHSHFDEIKNDYTYARYLLYVGESFPLFNEHFFNSTYPRVDSLDYSIDNLKAQHLRTTFKTVYSIFDKISFFLYQFFELGPVKNMSQVSFRDVWFPDRNKAAKRIPRQLFTDSQNPYFKALYFLSRDIRQSNKDKSKDLSYWLDPDTARLADIRNAMEHRSFKLVDQVCYAPVKKDPITEAAIEQLKAEHRKLERELEDLPKDIAASAENQNDLGPKVSLEKRIQNIEKRLDEKERLSKYQLTVGIEEFQSLTIKLTQMARCAIIYLSLAVEFEERNREDAGITLPSNVPYK